MKHEVLKLKEWFFDKIDHEAKWYNIFIDVDYENGVKIVEDDCVFAQIEERIAESEKAIKVRFSSGRCDGRTKGWETWIPRSVLGTMN